MIRARWLLAFGLLFLPTLAHADNFHVLNNQTVFQSRDHAYRVRSVTKPLQRAEQSGLAGPSIQIDQTVFSFFDGQLFRTTDGLRYDPIGIGVISQATFTKRAESYFLTGIRNGQVEIRIFIGGTWHLLSGPALPSAFSDGQLGSTNGKLTLIVWESGELKGYQLVGTEWQLRSAAPCTAATTFVAEPIVAAFCTDTISYRFDGNTFTSLLPEASSLRSHGSRLLVAGSPTQPNRIFLVTTHEIDTIELVAPEPVSAWYVVGLRVLAAFPTAGLYELRWQVADPTLILVTHRFTAVVPISGIDDAVAISAHPAGYYSEVVGAWNVVATVGEFNHGQRVSGGVWVWQTNQALTTGGLAQFLPTGAATFVKVNPWSSTTSPVQKTHLGQLPAYVSVITSSGAGNVNLYRSNDYVTWSRLTLPTVPTFVRSIGEVRTLPASSLVETSGTVSVPAGIVGGDVLYIQDDSGGIQVFLSASKGTMTWVPPTHLRITGEVSSSATSRIVLDAADDGTALGTVDPVVPRRVGVAELDPFRGQLVSIEDRVVELETDRLLLGVDTKAHFDLLGQNIKNLFRLGDRIGFSAIADWNTSTDTVELWYAGLGYQVTDRAPIAAKTTSKATAQKKTSSTKTSSAAPGKSASVAASMNVSPARKATVQPLVLGAGERSAPIQSPPQTSQRSSSLVLVFLGAITGMLAVQGRRFRPLTR